MQRIETNGLELDTSVRLASALRAVAEIECVSEPGAWRLSWPEVAGAQGYELQQTTNMIRCPWMPAATVLQNESRLPALSADEVWIRVRALGVTGSGPWSDPVLKRRSLVRMAA